MNLPGMNGGKRQYRRTKYGILEGTARTCDELGQIRSFTLYGAPDTRDASRMHVALTPVEKPAPPGLSPSMFRGIWDLGNTLHVEASFTLQKDGAAITGADSPDTRKAATLHMTRGADAEFGAVCARVKQNS